MDGLAAHILSDFKKKEGVDLSADQMAITRINEAAVKAREDLLAGNVAVIDLPFITATGEGPKHLKMDISQEEYNKLQMNF